MARYQGQANAKCCWKTPHATRKKAEKARLANMRGSPYKGRMSRSKEFKSQKESTRRTNVYECPVCGAWHWGHLPD